ncbi:helix-turn-helix transcriptional regulator [Castellaniella sp. WN]
MALDASSLTRLSVSLYDACYDADCWPLAAQALRGCLDSMAATLVVRRNTTFQTVHSDCDADFSQRYWLDFSSRDPMLAGPVPARRVYCDQTVMDRTRFQRTALFNDWLRPQDRHSVLLIKLPDEQGETAAIFALNRGGSQPFYGPDDLKACRQIGPLLVHAVRHQRRIEQLRLLSGAGHPSTDGPGHLVLDAGRRVRHLDSAAQALLDRHPDILGVRGGMLGTPDLAAASCLAHALLRACAGHAAGPIGADLLLRDAAGRPRLALHIAPLPHARPFGLEDDGLASLMLRSLRADVGPDVCSRLRALFDLSPKEAQLAQALMRGLSLREAAQERHVGLTTVRSQLASLFRKTGTTRQGQLIALLARAAAT